MKLNLSHSVAEHKKFVVVQYLKSHVSFILKYKFSLKNENFSWMLTILILDDKNKQKKFI